MWGWVAVALADEPAITISREKADIEKQAPYVVTSDMSDVKADDTYEKEFFRRRSVDRYAAMDETFRWELPAVEACAATTQAAGDVVARFTLEVDGVVKKVAVKGGDPALAGCVRDTFTGSRLPLTIGAQTVTYTFHFAAVPRHTPAPATVDRDIGVNGLRWGTKTTDYEGLESKTSDKTTTFYQRDTDYEIQWMGVPAAGIQYGFDENGLFVVIARFVGDDAKFKGRAALRARYGQGRIDAVTQAEYWRGQRNFVEARDAGDALVVTLLEIDHARASGLLSRLPGDKEDTKAKEVPRYLRKALETAEPAPAEPAAPATPPAAPTPAP